MAKKNGKSSVRLEVKDDITCSSGSGGRTVSTVPVSAKTGECEFYVTGQLFKTALGLMPKGSLVLDVKSQIVLFKSGSSEVVDETAAVGLMQVIHSVGKEKLKPDDDQAEEG